MVSVWLQMLQNVCLVILLPLSLLYLESLWHNLLVRQEKHYCKENADEIQQKRNKHFCLGFCREEWPIHSDFECLEVLVCRTEWKGLLTVEKRCCFWAVFLCWCCVDSRGCWACLACRLGRRLAQPFLPLPLLGSFLLSWKMEWVHEVFMWCWKRWWTEEWDLLAWLSSLHNRGFHSVSIHPQTMVEFCRSGIS